MKIRPTKDTRAAMAGRSIARALEASATPDDDTLARARAMFVASLGSGAEDESRSEERHRQRPRRVGGHDRRASRALAFAGFVAAAAAIIALYIRSDAPDAKLTFTVGTAAEPGRVGSWISATGDPVPLRFSDGSVLSLDVASHARVLAVQSDGASVAIEQGNADVAVVHRARTSWTVNVGPFEVLVTGTRFRVGWEPATRTFRLAMLEGTVVVRGCHTDEQVVSAGATIERRCADAAPRQASETPPVAASVEATHDTETIDEEPDAGQASAALVRSIQNDVVKTHATLEAETRVDDAAAWDAGPADPLDDARRRWASGDFAAAWDAVARDFDAKCLDAARADLAMLSEIARLSGHEVEATRSLLLLRRRHPRTEEAALAAFHLGLFALNRHEPASSAQWFLRAEQEAPRSAIVREAAGRRLEALVQQGDDREARVAARRYLDTYSDGPHAALARQLVDGVQRPTLPPGPR